MKIVMMTCECCVRMNDEPCAVMPVKYIDIVPHENFEDCEYKDFVNIKQEPQDSVNNVQIKVCDWHAYADIAFYFVACFKNLFSEKT